VLVLTGSLMPYQDGPEPQGSHMARKPKAAPNNEFAVSPEPVPAVLGDAPAPTRRGRKPKAAALPEPSATMDNDDAAGGSADGVVADPVAPPVRKRPGPKPKQQAGGDAAAPLRTSARAKPGREAQAPHADPGFTPAADDKPDVDVPGELEQVDDRGSATSQATPDPTAGGAATPGSSQNTTTSAQPAAQWDRATDTVRFDWAEIERTASQDGPNQIMAKLLVAARAEGANSRWPL